MDGKLPPSFICLCLLILWPGLAAAEPRQAGDAWAFIEAWTTFRYDLDATAPGEHGQVLLIERLEPRPRWLVRDGLRLSQSARTLALLARRAARDGDAGAIPALRRALAQAPDPGTRRVLERTLIRLGDAELRDELADRLRRGSTPERWEAAATLAAAGDAATPILRAALADHDDQTRMAAASVLAAAGDNRARGMLGEQLDSPNPYRRLEAAHALARAGDPRAVTPLRDRLAQAGSDRGRVARSLGLVGKVPEREALIQAYRALPRGRSKALRRELLLAVGRITVRHELAELAPRISGAEAADHRDARDLWLEEIGRAVAKGAVARDAMARAIGESLESPLLKETPVAHQRRRGRTEPLIALLKTGELPPVPQVSLPEGSRAELLGRLRARGGEARERLARFGAALALLERLGAHLGHQELAEPPAVRAVGLGADRAVDGNLLTAWIAGEMSGPLRLDLVRPARVRSLHLMGGCVEDRTSYRRHARVKRLVVRLDGTRTVEGRLADDDPYFQRIDLPGAETSRITLEVAEVYPGEREGAPACIPEIRLR